MSEQNDAGTVVKQQSFWCPHQKEAWLLGQIFVLRTSSFLRETISR